MSHDVKACADKAALGVIEGYELHVCKTEPMQQDRCPDKYNVIYSYLVK